MVLSLGLEATILILYAGLWSVERIGLLLVILLAAKELVRADHREQDGPTLRAESLPASTAIMIG